VVNANPFCGSKPLQWLSATLQRARDSSEEADSDQCNHDEDKRSQHSYDPEGRSWPFQRFALETLSSKAMFMASY
jgi:hypothetical protein